MVALAIAAGVTSDITAQAQDILRGKEINLYVGSAPGGPYDAYARLVARHLGKHLPGNPAIVVQNMPGASGWRVMGFILNPQHTSRAPNPGRSRLSGGFPQRSHAMRQPA